MKMLVTVISSLLVGLSLASSNFSPIQELQHFLVNKRRIFISAAIAVTGFIFLIAGLLIGLVEWALQFDGQGFVVWSALFTVASGVGIAGVLSMLLARVMIPPRLEPHQSILAELSKQFNVPDVLDAVMKHFAQEDAPAPTPHAPPEAPVKEPNKKEENFVAEPSSGFSEPILRPALHH